MSELPEFDETLAEDAVAKFLNSKLYPGKGFEGMPFSMLESTVPGVIAFCRPDVYEQRKFKWDELAAAVVRELGIGILEIANTDWETDEADEEAVYIAFDTPDTPKDYCNSYRTLIDEEVMPEDAPTAEDFAVRDRAAAIIGHRKIELSGKMGYLDVSTPEHDALQFQWTRLHDYSPNARLRELNEAIVALDFDRADELLIAHNQENELVAAPAP